MTIAPITDAVAGPPGLDKTIHTVLFGGLALILYWNLSAEARRRRGALIAGTLSTVLAGVIELVQAPIPYRSGDVADFLAGLLGAALGAALAHLTRRPSAPT